MDAWRERIRAHAGCACVHVLVNEGHLGGASLPHTHAQLYALDFVPAAVARERERFGAYATRTMGGNLLGDLVQEEVRRRERLVAVDDETVLFAPYASRLPFQLMIAPRRSRARFEDDGPLGARTGARGAHAAAPPPRRRRRRSTCGCAPRRTAPTTSAGGSTSSRGSRTWPGSSSAPACTSASSRPSRRRRSCARCSAPTHARPRPARQPRLGDRRRRARGRDRARAARAARRHARRRARRRPTSSPTRCARCASSPTPRGA